MAAECVTHHYACDCREAAHAAEIDRLTAQLDAWTTECPACKGGGFTPARFNSAVSQKCNDCKGTGRTLRCQGRLEAAEKMRTDLAAWVESAQTYDAAVRAERLSSARSLPASPEADLPPGSECVAMTEQTETTQPAVKAEKDLSSAKGEDRG